MVLQFTELEDFVFSLRLLRRGLRNSVATSAEHFVALRHRLISNHAALCAVHFILGESVSYRLFRLISIFCSLLIVVAVG